MSSLAIIVDGGQERSLCCHVHVERVLSKKLLPRRAVKPSATQK